MNRISNPILSITAILALAGAAAAQSVPIRPSTPDPIDATSNTVVSASSMWSMTSSEDGRTYKIESKDGTISAEVDGKPVPADRIMQDGDTVRIKDDKGETLFETKVPMSGATGQVFSLTSPRSSLFGTPRARGGASSPFGGDRLIRVEAAAAPPVMIGIQLVEPDASIRGHLGLKENESTMVGAVYEGLPAATAGLEPYDIIVRIDGKSPASPEAVRKALRATEAGKSISLTIVHRGQEKTVAVTPEKYDHARLDKAKINAIAAATGTPSANALASSGDPTIDLWMNRALGGSTGGQSLIATAPGQNGKPLTLWLDNNIGAGGQNMDDFAKRMQAMAEQMQAQAESARRDAERLHEQLRNQSGNNLFPATPGGPGQFDDRMKKMEDMLQKLMEQREKKAGEKSDAQSRNRRITLPDNGPLS